MRVTLNSNRDLRSVLDALSAMNVVMGTDSFRDEANKIAGDKAEQAKGDNAKFSRAISGITNFTPSQITESLRQSPFVGKFIDKLLARGEKGRRGGVIVAKDIEDAQRLFEEKTGRELGDDVLKSVKRDQTYARFKSGLAIARWWMLMGNRWWLSARRATLRHLINHLGNNSRICGFFAGN